MKLCVEFKAILYQSKPYNSGFNEVFFSASIEFADYIELHRVVFSCLSKGL